MPSRPPATSRSKDSSPARETFRQRYDELEARRERLTDRLRNLGAAAQNHPGYKRAQTLVNETFRKSRLGQRLAVLQAATWLIDLLERMTTLV